jgi:hypothetical protein
MDHLSAEIQLNLFDSVQINLQTPYAKIKQITLNNLMFSRKEEKELRRYSPKCAISLELEKILLNRL